MLALLWACFLVPAGAATTTLEQVLGAASPPSGVVFEIVEGDEDALSALLPRVREAIAQLRARFPDIELAVVSHGGEQFALQTRYREEYASVHEDVQALASDAVPLHVCGTHASWYGVTPEDFPAYVDVAPTGPAQIRQYQELGYELVRIRAED